MVVLYLNVLRIYFLYVFVMLSVGFFRFKRYIVFLFFFKK